MTAAWMGCRDGCRARLAALAAGVRDRFACSVGPARASVREGEPKSLVSLWNIWNDQAAAEKERWEAAEAFCDSAPASADPFRAWEYLANDAVLSAKYRLAAAQRLTDLDHPRRAAGALWGLAVESGLPAQQRIDAAGSLHGLDIRLCAGAYRVLAYDRSMPKAVRVQAAEWLWGLVPADGDRALRDLLWEQSQC